MANLVSQNDNNDSLSLTVNEYQNQMTDYLKKLNLPSEHVLVDTKERQIVIALVPTAIADIDVAKRGQSFYISKFIAACGAGLFDAALNYLWDETIICLRRKIVQFDLDYFKSTLLPDKAKKIHSEEDLRNVDDYDVVVGCQKIGLISDVGFKHLDYIRWMRNWVSAAHPNHEELNGLKLCDWLQTCIKEVIGMEPIPPVVANQRLIINIKNNELQEKDINPIVKALDSTPTEYVVSLAITLFGMFCDPDGKREIKNNIRLIAKQVWNLLPEKTKKDFGLRHATWSANADIPHRNAAHDFLELVGGLSYLSDDNKAAELADVLSLLRSAHFGINNFYNEPAFASMVIKYIPDTGKIPDSIQELYVKVICLCTIGNGYGISNAAEPYYKKMISNFTDSEIAHFLKLFGDLEFSTELRHSDCYERCAIIINSLKTKTSKTSYQRVFDYLCIVSPKALQYVREKDDYKRLISLMNP